MNELVSTVISVLGILTILGQAILVFLLILLVIPKKKNSAVSRLYEFIRVNAFNFAFLVASIATFGSLFLSEVAGFIPCKLCWWQRIFMYPSALILFISLLVNDRGVAKYILPLSGIGALIAIYHYIMQLFPNILECSEETAKCSAVQFMEFGYVTIPLMAFTAFLLIIVSLLFTVRK